MFSFVNQASATLQTSHEIQGTFSNGADGEMVRDDIYTHYWMNFKKERKCQVFKHLKSHFSKFETKF